MLPIGSHINSREGMTLINKRPWTILMILFAALCMNACTVADSTIKRAEKDLGIELADVTVLASEDTHEGFHYDGCTYAAMEISDEQQSVLEKNIQAADGWKEIPLTDFLEDIIYGGEYNSSYVADDKGEALFPEIQQGYYYAYDESSGRHGLDEGQFQEQHSHNFVIALYDSQRGRLYYYKFDS